MLFWPPNIREICFLTPYLYKKLRLWPLFWDTWRVLINFGTKGAKIAIFFIGGQNRNILKLRGKKVQFSLLYNININGLMLNIGVLHVKLTISGNISTIMVQASQRLLIIRRHISNVSHILHYIITIAF